jgi:LysR family transcriptional regulator, nitrogen assimilation regulatory protein
MQANDFRLFLEVVEHGSFSRVAAQRGTVQSYISRQISELEKECGGALFRRTGRGVVLTEFGRHVEHRARHWLTQSDELIEEIRQTGKEPMGEVRIGIVPSAAHPLMSHVFAQLRREYPRIRLNIREGQGGELDALLETGSVDLAILFRHARPKRHDEVLLATANTYLVSAPGAALTVGETVDFRRLKGLPLVLPRRPSQLRSVLEETARGKGFQLAAVVEADSLRVQKEIVAANPTLYALMGPFSIEEELQSGRLHAAKIVSPELKRYVSLAMPRQGHVTQAVRVVSGLIAQTVRAWHGQISGPRMPRT